MRENGVHQFFFRGFKSHGQDEALDQFRDFRADHMGANQASGFCVENGLDQALIFAQRNGFAVGEEGEAADLQFVSGGFCFGLREANGGDLWMAIGAAGNLLFLHRVRGHALDAFNADDTFMFGLVGQHRRACHVTNGIDAPDVGAAIAIASDAAFLHFHTQGFKAEVFNIGDNACCGDDTVHRDGFGFASSFQYGRHRVSLAFELRHFGSKPEFDAVFFELLLRHFTNLGIFHRHDLIHDFNHRHINAHGVIERGELYADGAGADDEQ